MKPVPAPKGGVLIHNRARRDRGRVLSGNAVYRPESSQRYHARVNGPSLLSFRSTAFALLLSASIAAGQYDSFQIRDTHVGRAHVGMTVEDFYSAFDRREVKLVDQDLEGVFSPALEVRSNGHVLLMGEVDKRDGACIIFRITVKDPRFHTTRGISVCSTYADLERAYPGLKILMGEGRQFAFSETESLSFGLDADIRKPPADRSRVASILILR